MVARALVAALLALVTGCPAPPSLPASQAGPELQLEHGIVRLDLRFACGAVQCAGWLFRPAAVARPPVVVMGPGFAATRDVALPFFAQRFAARGFAALVFDYRHFGASGGGPRQLVDPWEQLDDWASAIAFVRSRGDLDSARIALWGASMSAGHALISAARDHHVRAVVGLAPVVDTSVQYETVFRSEGHLLRLSFVALADLAAEALGAAPITIPAFAPTGRFGMIVDDVAFASFLRVVEPGSEFRNEIAARSVLTFSRYDPAVQAAPLGMPVLLIASQSDRFVPFAVVERFARAHPRARIETFEGDHFDAYSPPASERAADLGTAFLVGVLSPELATSP